METIEINKILFNTAFSCMACDGDIDKNEVQLIRTIAKESNIFEGVGIEQELELGVEGINKNGFNFLSKYFNDIEKSELSFEDELNIIKVAIATIFSDDKVEYSELKFFKVIFMNLKITANDLFEKSEVIYSFVKEFNKDRLENLPDLEGFKSQLADDFLSDDVFSSSYLNKLKNKYFDSVNLPTFDASILKFNIELEE